MRSLFDEFKEFIQRGNVIDLAVGIVIGTAFKDIVDSMVNDIIMPPIGMLLDNVDFSNLFINLSDGSYDSLAAAQEAGAATVNYGMFINTVINFLIIAFVVFIIVRQINIMRRAGEEEAAPAEPTTKKCPYCYSEIAIEATRCPNCTSELTQGSA